MPRKSSFKNKKLVEEPVKELVEEPVEEVKKIALKKKERKPRKKRSKKVKKEEPKPEETYEEIIVVDSDLEQPVKSDTSSKDSIMAKLAALQASRSIVIEPKLEEPKQEEPKLEEPKQEEPKQKKPKQKKSMLSKLASKVSPFTKKVKTPEPKLEETYEEIIVVDSDLEQPVKSDTSSKDSIMAKLAALQASRNIIIEPKSTPPPKMKQIPIMKELIITPDEKKIEQLKEKPVPKSENKKVIDCTKTYKLYIDLEQEDDVCKIDFNNDRRTELTLYRMLFNKKQKTLVCSYFCGEKKWTTGKRFRLKELKNTITFKPSYHTMHLQIKGVYSGSLRRRNPALAIDVATWDCKTLKIV